MKRGDVIVALLLPIILTSCMGGMVAPPAAPLNPASQEIQTLVELVNQHRRKVGCKDLVWHEAVAAVAQKHSDDMVRRGYFDHRTPEGRTPFERLDAARLRYMRAAENIAAGQETAQAVMNSWLDSPGHRRNIEDCAMREHGIGFTRGPAKRPLPFGVVYNAWTHNFTALRS